MHHIMLMRTVMDKLGAMMSLGKGAVISFSRKQKLNVRSSTEGELVRIDEALLWIH